MSHESLQEIVCCMGQPVAGNPSQYVMEKAFAAAGLDWRYLTIEVGPEQLGDAVRGMRAMGFRGGNFAAPHQASVIPYLDGVSVAAELTGAVNCAYREGDQLLGENTVGKGFLRAVQAVLDPQGKKAVIVGTGYAARAIAIELGLAGAAEVAIVSPEPERGQPLVDLLRERLQIDSRLFAEEEADQWDLDVEILVSARSTEQENSGPRVPIKPELLRPALVVADLVVSFPPSDFLQAAIERGCTTFDGLTMLVEQDAIGFETWTGEKPDRLIMQDSLEEFLSI